MTNPNYSLLDTRVQRGARVRHLPTGHEGVVTRVIDTSGARGGLAEVRFDFQKRVSRSAGFQFGDELAVIKDAPAV